jgi:hypothetical protein
VLVAVLQAYRLLSGRRGINETAVGQVRAMHWTMVLCHVETPEQVGPLLEDAIRWRESPASGRTHPVLYLERGITTGEAREQARSHSLADDLSEAPPVFVVATPADLPLQPPDEPGRFRGSDLVLVLGGSALAFAVLATFIPGAESAYCSGSSCSGRPVTYGDALYWVLAGCSEVTRRALV